MEYTERFRHYAEMGIRYRSYFELLIFFILNIYLIYIIIYYMAKIERSYLKISIPCEGTQYQYYLCNCTKFRATTHTD